MTIDRAALKSLLEREWEQRDPDNGLFGNLDVEPYLGEEDANTEWSANPDEESSPGDSMPDYSAPSLRPEETFTKIPAFDEFANPTNLFLYGRRGTGKTAILRMLQHRIRRGEYAHYQHCWVLQSETLHTSLAEVVTELGVDSESDTNLVPFIAEIWNWVIWTCSFAEAWYACSKGRLNISEADREAIEVYLRTVGVRLNSPHWYFSSGIARRLKDALHLSTPSSTIRRRRYDLLAALESETYKRARDAVERVLHSGPRQCILILIDSPDTFHLDQRPHFEGLLKCVAEFGPGFKTQRILAKASIASEMYPYLSQYHPSRTGGTKELFIRWRYRDLLPFAALRLSHLLPDRLAGFVQEPVDSKAGALSTINALLPSHVRSRNGMVIPTMPYLLRHTQKTPRQLLFLLNAILSAARTQRIAVEEIRTASSDLIRWGVHAQLDHVINTIINIPEKIDPEFSDIIMRTLTNNHTVFDYGQLDKYMRPLQEQVGHHFDTREKRRKALINSGLLGILRSMHYVAHMDTWILTASYEYQVKDTLQPTTKDIFVAHPIVFEHMRMWVSKRTLIYPYPYEDDEKDELLRLGINLV